MIRVILLGLSLTCLLWFPIICSGYGQFNPNVDGNAGRWLTTPVVVVVDGGTLFGQSNGLALIQQAVDIWNAVPDVPSLLVRPTTTVGIDINLTSDDSVLEVGKINVIFDEGGEIFFAFGADPTSGILGLGYADPDPNTGRATIGLMLINGHPSASGPDLLETIVHEFGHILGLTHTPVGFGGLQPVSNSAIPTMYPFATGGDGTTLEADDKAGIRAIYGQ